ncbi:MAG: glutathione ABC transporter substrate-binding protein [Clostridia bacterium]|nr:glutathione ABC transporter substrate-binding protein [Clostridia bacterium]
MKKVLAALALVLSLVFSLSVAFAAGDTLIVGNPLDAVSLDPHRTNDAASALPMFQIYDTLVKLSNEMTIEPGLATEWTQIDDFTTEFKLRQGVKFHNGEELKASDVKFTIERHINPETAAPAAFMLSTVSEVKVIDDYTVQIITKEKCASLLYNLTHVDMGILSEKAVTEAGDSYATSPVGTGAYKFVSWKKNQEIRLVRNDEYFGEKAKVENLVIRIIPEGATMIAELQTGGVDIALNIGSQFVPMFMVPGTGIKLEQFSTFTIKYLSFDQRIAPFNDARVRQAINYATNKDAIVKVAYSNCAEPLSGPLPKNINGFNDTLVPYEYNVAKAKELLAEAGYPDGFTTTLYISDKEIDNKLAVVLQAQLKDIGVNVDIQVIEWGTYLQKTAEGLPLFIMGWTTVTADADNGLYANFHSSAWGSQGNRSFYKNEKVDELLDAGRAEFDQAARTKLYQDACQIIYDDAGWDFLAAELYNLGLRENVQGFVPSSTTFFDLSTVYFN